MNTTKDRTFQTTEIAHKLTQKLTKLPAEHAVILSILAPGEIGSLLSRLNSLDADV